MKTTRRPSPLTRHLLAVLTVLASFVFQLRIDGLGGLKPGPMPVEMAHAGHTHHVPQAPAHHAHSPQPQPSEGQPDPHEGHKAHCPFCIANAFALEAGPIGLPAGPPPLATSACLGGPFRLASHTRHADARAPPAVGA